MVRGLEMILGIPPLGVGIFTASLILAVMIIPYAASIGTEVIKLVPADLKEAALSLGATRFEVIRKVVLPYAYSGIFAGILLALATGSLYLASLIELALVLFIVTLVINLLGKLIIRKFSIGKSYEG